MNRENIRKILRESGLYSESGIKKIMSNVRTPTLTNALTLEKSFGLSVSVWDGWIDKEKREKEFK